MKHYLGIWFALFAFCIVTPPALTQPTAPQDVVAPQPVTPPAPAPAPGTMQPIPDEPDAPAVIPVTAVTPTATTVSVNVGTIMDAMIALLATIVTAVTPWIAWRITAWAKISRDSQLGKIIEDAIRNGLNLAIAKASEATANWVNSPSIKKEIVVQAQAYANEHVPTALSTLGVTQKQLVTKLESRLALATNIAKKVPVVVESPVIPEPKPI